MFDIEQEREQKVRSMSKPYVGDATLEGALFADISDDADKKRIDSALEYLRSSEFIGREANYMAHAVRVALYFKKYGSGKVDGIVLGLLHNLYEVTDKSESEVVSLFGQWVSDACKVLVVDRDRQKNDTSYPEEYYSSLAAADKEVQQIKVLDKLDNILVLFLNPSDEVRTDYLAEIEEYIFPMVKSSLEGLEAPFTELLDQAKQYSHQTLDDYIKSHGIEA